MTAIKWSDPFRNEFTIRRGKSIETTVSEYDLRATNDWHINYTIELCKARFGQFVNIPAHQPKPRASFARMR
jgi:hypothetical protein